MASDEWLKAAEEEVQGMCDQVEVEMELVDRLLTRGCPQIVVPTKSEIAKAIGGSQHGSN